MSELSSPPAAASLLPMSPADRAWAHAGTVCCIVGPLKPTDPVAVAGAARRLAAAGPHTRVGLVRSGLQQWRYLPDGPDPEHLIVPVGDLSEAEFRARVAELVASPEPTGGAERPVRLVVADRWFALINSHVFGDGSQVMRVVAALLTVAHGAELPAWTAQDPQLRPLRTALRRTFRGLRDVRAVLADRPSLPVDAPTGTELPWQPQPTLVAARTTTATRKAFAAWGAEHAPGASLSALSLAGLRTALAAEGFALDPASSVAINARRYLPRGAFVPGNFAARLVVAPGEPNSPVALHEAIEHATEVGRPLAALAASALGSRRLRSAPPAPSTATDGVPAHLGYSWFGRPMEIERLPWDAPTDERLITGSVDPGGPEQFGSLVFQVGGGLQFSLNFHANRHDAMAVQRAVESLAEDPMKVLECGDA